jgi:hypothetical protein
MNKKTFFYKRSNTLIKEILKQDLAKLLKEQNLVSKLFSKKKYPDIYFFSGNLDEKSLEYIKNSKITITNSYSSKKEILEKLDGLDIKKDIELIYPSVNIDLQNEDEIKSRFLKEHNLNDEKLILFTAKNFKTNGVKEFLDICSKLSFKNFKIIISGRKQELNALDFTLTKYKNLQEKIIKLDENISLEELFIVSDIMILPTHNRLISSNIVKAMYCKCVVFVSAKNDVKELIDVYATMDKPSDPSTPFKVDAVLYEESELNKIKEENSKIAQELSLKNNLGKFIDILNKI